MSMQNETAQTDRAGATPDTPEALGLAAILLRFLLAALILGVGIAIAAY